MSIVREGNELFGNETKTLNGAKAYKSTLGDCLDLFYAGGASRTSVGRLSDTFVKALGANSKVAAAIQLWIRDIRHGGAGERKAFRELCKTFTKLKVRNWEQHTLIKKIIKLIPVVGRYDDLKVFYGTKYHGDAVKTWVNGMKEGDYLAFKWAKRNDKALQKELNMDEAQLRKYLAKGRSKPALIETLISEKRFSEIDYAKIPSMCFARNSRLFAKEDGERFQAFLDNQNTKVKAGAIFPHDIYRTMKYGNEAGGATKQWEALKETFSTDKNILVMADVSGSMDCQASGKITCMDISVSLGTFLAETNTGFFKNKLMTFSQKPNLVEITKRGGLREKFNFVERMNWGMNTDFEAAYKAILSSATKNQVPAKDMPEYLLVLSDMQFDQSAGGWGNRQVTHFENAKDLFSRAGYKLPKLIFWNLHDYGNAPTTKYEGDVALVSGFSPGVLKAVIAGEAADPQIVMKIAIEPFLEMLNNTTV